MSLIVPRPSCGEYGNVFFAANESEVQTLAQESGYRLRTFDLCHYTFNPSLRYENDTDKDAFILRRDIGSFCARLASGAARIGSVVNAAATAQSILYDLKRGHPVTLGMCGEYYPPVSYPGYAQELLFSVEDLLGAGAILAHLPEEIQLTAEGLAAKAVFEAARNDLVGWIRRIRKDFPEPERACFEQCVALNQYDFVPIITHGHILERYTFSEDESPG